MARTQWTRRDVPDQTDRNVIITGANSGVGLETARTLAQRGARVLLAVRDVSKGAAAATEIRASAPEADVTVGELDLASLTSIRAFAATVRDSERPIDVLINNAGIMAVPEGRTADGFELQFGTNHLGHFALSGLLVDRLLEGTEPRVVTVSSLAHRQGTLDFEDLMSSRRYRPFTAYAASKLANLLFTMELQRRLRQAGRRDVMSLAAHPGVSETGLSEGMADGLMSRANRLLGRYGPSFAQSAEEGAVPILRAATDPDVDGGDYFGPAERMETRGPAVKVKARPKAYDVHDARGLWEASVELTGVDYAALAPPT